MFRRRSARVLTLATMDVLSGTALRDLDAVSRLTTELSFPAGAVLCKQGALAQEVFLIISGEVAISLDDAVVGVVGPGSIVGEMGVLDGSHRRATATTLTDTILLVMSRCEFDQLLRALPQVEANVRALAAERTQELLATG